LFSPIFQRLNSRFKSDFKSFPIFFNEGGGLTQLSTPKHNPVACPVHDMDIGPILLL